MLRGDESRFGGQNSKPRGFRRSVPPSGTLFVGNLPYAISEAELKECFASFGEIVRVSLGTTPEGLNRGFGHVQFASVDDACKVMKADEEDPIYVMNRDIYLDHAAVQEDVVREPYHTLFIRPFSGAEDNLREVFNNFEHSVVDVRILRDKSTGESKGSGFVEFKDAEAATEALEALKDHRDPSTGRQVTIKYAKPARLDSKPDLRNKPNRDRQRFDRVQSFHTVAYCIDGGPHFAVCSGPA